MLYNEEDLIREAQQGNNEAFGRLYDHHVRTIYEFIFYRTRHKETAEDLTSQTFFKALRSIQSVDPARSFISWLYKIAHNNIVDFFRTQRHTADIDEIFDISDTTNIPETLDARAEGEKVKQYLSKLTDVERQIILMRVWDELSYKDIAEILGKTEASCKMAYSRALKKLKLILPILLFLILITKTGI